MVLPAGERVDPNVTLTVTDLGAPPFTLPYTLAGDGTAFEGDLPPDTTFRGTLALFGTPLEGWSPMNFALEDGAGEIVLERR